MLNPSAKVESMSRYRFKTLFQNPSASMAPLSLTFIADTRRDARHDAHCPHCDLVHAKPSNN